MNTPRSIFFLLASLVLGLALSAETLAPSAAKPKIDGQLAQGEYTVQGDHNGMTIGASLSKDGTVLSLAIQAPTAGWVAIGLGSNFMNGAYLVMAYEAEGKAAVTEQIGVGHSHGLAKGTKLLASAVHSTGGVTTFEFQVKVADFAKGGKLPLIMAYGRSADFVSKHVRYSMMSLSFTS